MTQNVSDVAFTPAVIVAMISDPVLLAMNGLMTSGDSMRPTHIVESVQSGSAPEVLVVRCITHAAAAARRHRVQSRFDRRDLLREGVRGPSNVGDGILVRNRVVHPERIEPSVQPRETAPHSPDHHTHCASRQGRRPVEQLPLIDLTVVELCLLSSTSPLITSSF